MATQTITEEEYGAEVREQARHLADALDDSEREETPVAMIVDVLDGHEWFGSPAATRRGLSGADYGAIISDYNQFGGNIELNRDPETLTTGGDFQATLKKMAFGEFEADVLKAYEAEDF